MTMGKNLAIKSVALLRQPDDDEGYDPEFEVRGTWKGEAFAYVVCVEVHGRDAEWEHKEGADPNDPDGPDWSEWLDEHHLVYEAIHATDDFKRLDAAE